MTVLAYLAHAILFAAIVVGVWEAGRWLDRRYTPARFRRWR